ncbi:E3 ubiquitin-protein ligase TRIM7-like isoform X2 [Scyliorhinus canicula]|uniref:E3 ubiquitin-protein ligase TRIM7-like isoform X2 n=1 Tax=Scyliorhinus canicula TaxID=7830 RepID=UPI0018F52E4E|nr:E3 ubiquitin-protein ligase TRIM7-like isoform X2 [Scyliorhinus canicula]
MSKSLSHIAERMAGPASAIETSCCICNCSFPDTEQLPCGHYLCSNCTEDTQARVAGEDTMCCPLCGDVFPFDPSPALPQPDKPEEAASLLVPAAGLLSSGEDPEEANVCDPLGEPSTDLTGKRCQEHNEVLEFYCEDDGECVCSPCTITGMHKSHSLMSFRNAEIQIKTQIDQLKGNLSKKFAEWRKSLEEDEDFAMKTIEEEGLKVLTKSVEYTDELNKRMHLIKLIDDDTQELVHLDPFSLIQKSNQVFSQIAETQKQSEISIPKLILNLYNAPELIKDRMNNSFTYQSAILGTTNQWSILSLDPDSAYWLLNVSDDEKTVMFGYMGENSWHNSKMFENMHQILCAQSFTAGCHSWDVKTGGIAWGVGVAYGTIERGGLDSYFTNSNKSWCLYFYRGSLTACHKNQQTFLIKYPAISRMRIQLDYEAGTVSFYQVNENQQHLHTFKTTFTEPVFPAFSCSGNSSIKLC